MRRLIDKKLIQAWAKSVGGNSKATVLIMEATGLSASAAEKLVRGVYPSELQYLLRKAIADLVGTLEETLFPPVGAGRKRAS